MGVTPVEFATFCSVSEDVGRQVKQFLLGESAGDAKFERRDSASSTESEEKFTPNVNMRENVEGWDDWGDEKPLTSNENDESAWNWIFKCSMQTYFDAEYILVSWESRFVVLQKPPMDQKYRIICKNWVDRDEVVGSEITASCIFGLSNSRHTDQLDCLIIALGTLDGHVYFYTEKGTLLYFDRFSIYEPVNNLHFESVKRCQAFLVVFSRTFFVINPISLRSALHKAKILIAKGEKNVQEVADSIELQLDLINPDVKSNIINVVFTGLHQPTTLQQYVNATWESFNARVERPLLPTYSTFLVTTEETFVTFVWYDKDEADQIWKEAIKYGKSLIPSFGFRKYFGISTEPAKKAAHMHSAQHAPTRSQILDTRVAQSVARSPDSRFVAIVDRMARVVVVDILFRTTVLMFKGYRDASISWVSTVEGKKYGQFLAIFAPRRSLLEVWSILGNVRVCARHVPNSECDLISGGETRFLCGDSTSHVPNTSFFVDEKGEFHQLIIPFHLALNGRATQDQHDQILLKNIEKLDIHSTQWLDTFSTLKMPKSRRVAFQNAISLVEYVEEAHTLLAKIRTTSAAQSLAKLPDEVEKSVVFYGRIVKERAEAEKYEKIGEYGMDDVVRRIVDCHLMQYENESSDETLLKLGDWLVKTDLNTEVDPFSESWTDESRTRLANLIFYPVYCESQVFDVEEFQDTIVEKIPFPPIVVVKLLCLKMKNGTEKMNWRIFNRIVQVLVSLEGCYDMNAREDKECTDIVQQFAMDSRNISLSIVTMAICWCSRILVDKERKKMKNKEEDAADAENDTTNWDAVSPELEHLDSMLMCLHCVAMSVRLRGEEDEGPRIVDLVQRIDSYCRENVSKWIVKNDVSKSIIEQLYPKDPTEVLGEDGETEEDRVKRLTIDWPENTEENQEPEGIEFARRIASMMPWSFEHDLVVADVCWEMMCSWFRDKDTNFNLFEKCTALLSTSIDDRRLRHGIGRLIWDKFVATGFETIIKIVEDTGRMPKEKEMRKKVGMSEIRVVEFLVECEKLLIIMMDSVRDMPVARDFRSDVLVEMSNSSFAIHLHQPTTTFRKDQLSTIAAKLPLVNYHLVQHHYQLALAVRIQLTVGLSCHPLRSLFCLVGNRAFFVRLDSHPLIPLDRVDDAILEKRHAFLTKVAEQGSISERRLAKILEGEWNLTVNSIALMQAVSSFRLGHDSQAANELLSCVRDERAAAAMARLLAARMAQLMMEKKTIMIPKHEKYLIGLAGDEIARVELATEEFDDPSLEPNPKTWFDAIGKLGRTSAPMRNASQQAALSFVRLNDIAMQYWGIRWM